jgi:hypothetical protein
MGYAPRAVCHAEERGRRKEIKGERKETGKQRAMKG